jgi:hypothetical protein
VVGKRRSLGRTFHVGAYAPSKSRVQYSDENDFGHDIRYDLGVERNGIKGAMHLYHDTDRATLDGVISASKFGFYPTLIVPNVNHVTTYPPMFVRFPASVEYDYYAPNMASVELSLLEVSKGIEVVG